MSRQERHQKEKLGCLFRDVAGKDGGLEEGGAVKGLRVGKLTDYFRGGIGRNY